MGGTRTAIRTLGRSATFVAAACAVLQLASGSAMAAAGNRQYASGQVGYSGTGAAFSYAAIWATLPDAGHFAGQLGRVGVSLQLWSRSLVIDLYISACTDKGCQPSGKPADNPYNVSLSVYGRSTHDLICSTRAVTKDKRCPQSPRSWRTYRPRAGRSVGLSLLYNRMYGYVDAQVGDSPSGAGVDYRWPSAGGSQRFGQARIVAQFGPSPWSVVSFRPPRVLMRVITLGIPPPPPWFAEFATFNYKFGSCIDARWTHHRVLMTNGGSGKGHLEALATAPWEDNCDFAVDLVPWRA